MAYHPAPLRERLPGTAFPGHRHPRRTMTEPPTRHRVIDRLATVLEWALGLRIAAADVVQWLAQRKGSLCVFPDSTIYWLLAGTIRDGAPFEVLEWGDAPHFALRTPGYPLFLALCRLLFGDRTLAVRLVQAGERWASGSCLG